MIRRLASYDNGNYHILLLDDGTKIRSNSGEPFKADFPENIDLKVSNFCDIGCPFCHENSSIKWKQPSNDYLLNYTKFFKSLKPGTELAIGGGSLSTLICEDKELDGGFKTLVLWLTKHRHIIVNMTFNQFELSRLEFYRDPAIAWAREIIYVAPRGCDKESVDLEGMIVNGVGVSLTSISDEESISRLLKIKETIGSHLVVHTIAGLSSPDVYKFLAKNGFKILILGYKTFGRGIAYSAHLNFESNMNWLKENLQYLSDNCETVSFDCLATEQLELKKMLPKEIWDKYYMGDDGKFTMYVDLAEGKYAVNSTTPYDQRFDIPESQDVVEMFKNILTNN